MRHAPDADILATVFITQSGRTQREEQPMVGEDGASIDPLAQDDVVPPSSREDELEEGLKKLVLVVIAGACVILLVELVLSHTRRVGDKLASRHPLLAELMVGRGRF